MRRALSVILLALAAPAFAQHATVTETVLSPDVVVIRGRAENMVVLRTDAGLVIVDALISPLHARLARERLEARYPRMPVRYLIATHYHPDHNFGAQEFPEATYITHANAAMRAPSTQATADEYLRAPAELDRLHAQQRAGAIAQDEYLTGVARWETRLARYAGFARRTADLVIDGSLTLRIGGKTVDIRHPAPAHTDGDLIVHFTDDGVLATGDLVFNRIVPVIDLEGGVDLDGWVAALDELPRPAGSPVRVVPGHGDAGGLELLTEQADYLRELLASVRKARADGLTLEQARAAAAPGRFSAYEPVFGDHAGNVEACWRWLDARAG